MFSLVITIRYETVSLEETRNIITRENTKQNKTRKIIKHYRSKNTKRYETVTLEETALSPEKIRNRIKQYHVRKHEKL